MKKLVLVLISLFVVGALNAQNQYCATDDINAEFLKNNPQYAALADDMKRNWAEHVARQKRLGQRPVIEGTDTIYEIPVVVHVIHTGGAIGTAYNPSDALIQNWIDHTNEIFEGTAPGYLGPESGGARIPIRLVLAQRDEDCNPTDGIVRVDGSSVSGYSTYGLKRSSALSVEEASIRGLSRWDPSVYYNVYVVNKIDGEDGYSTIGSFVAGYAYLPFSVSSAVDGTFMLAYIVGENEVFAHEVGHGFGLYHTFQGGGSGVCPPTETDCATQGDEVCDTERNAYTFGACPTNADINPCTGTNYTGTQYNVMNYGNCIDRFTPGQAERVKWVIANYRMQLANSLGATPPPTTSYEPIAASCAPPFIADPGNSAQIGPCNIFFGDIARYSKGFTGDGEFYIDHTSSCAGFPYYTTEMLGTTLPLTVSITTNTQNIRAYIDYNNDGVFDETTETVMSVNSAAPGTHSVDVTLPTASAHVGVPLRMRVVADFVTAPISACGSLQYGQAEDFTVILAPDPLSTDALAMNVFAKDCGTAINWEIASTEHISSFEVQRSEDGRKFSTIATVAANENMNSYTYADDQATPGKNFYRLRLIDHKGKIRLSNTEVAEVICNTQFVVYPNPAENLFTIDFQSLVSAEATLRIVDMLGRTVLEEQVPVQTGRNSKSFDISAWADGAYIVEFVVGQNKHQSNLIKK